MLNLNTSRTLAHAVDIVVSPFVRVQSNMYNQDTQPKIEFCFDAPVRCFRSSISVCVSRMCACVCSRATSSWLTDWLRLQCLVCCSVCFQFDSCLFFCSYSVQSVMGIVKKWCSSHNSHICETRASILCLISGGERRCLCMRYMQREQLFQFNLSVSIARAHFSSFPSSSVCCFCFDQIYIN